MKALFLFIFLLGSYYLSGQITFNKTYTTHDVFPPVSDVGRYVSVDDDGYTALSYSACFGNFTSCIGLVKTDFEGKVIWKKVITNPLHLRPGGRFVKTPDGGYAIAGDQYVDGWEYQFFLLRLDSKGDSLWLKFYNDDVKDFPRNIVMTPDGGFIIHGDGGNLPSGLLDKTIMKTDANGNLLWEKNLDLVPKAIQNQFGNLVLSPDGTMAIAYRADYNIFGPSDSLALTKLTSNGEVLWTKNYYALSPLCGPVLRVLPNGSYIVTGCKEIDEFDLFVTFLLLDPNGNVIKEMNRQTYWVGGIWDFSLATNGDILACGRADTIITGYGYGGWVWRLDSDLNTLWERSYVSLQHKDAAPFYSIKETPDGGIIVCGGPIYDTLENGVIDPNLWLLKLDGNGCQQPGCDVGLLYLDVEEKDGINFGKQVFFSVAPNPVSHTLSLQFFNPVLLHTNAVLKLFNVSGTLVNTTALQPGIKELALDVSAFPPGLYLLVFEQNGLVVQREKVVVQRK